MANDAQHAPPLGILIKIFLIWVVADAGYYLLIWLLGSGSSYSHNPFIMAGYYLVWVGVAYTYFRRLYTDWHPVEPGVPMLILLVVAAAVIACYLAYVLPLFPAIHWVNRFEPPPELLIASPWYFLPKSIEIALQQLLVAALVLSFDARKFALRDIAQWTAVLFGGVHLLLIFGESFAYTVFFVFCASIAGYIFPYLLLRVRNGFIYSYSLHWAFYAIVIVLVRVLYVR